MSKPEAAERPDVDDVEGLLLVMTENDTLWLWRNADGWRFLESRTREQLVTHGVTESTRQRTGGGDYKARIRQSNGQWREQRRFAIAGDAKPVPGPESATSGTAATTAAPAANLLGMPDWLKPLIGPILAAIGAGMAARMFEKPTLDPVMLKLLESSRRNDGSIDPIELNRLLLEAERRGEERGREIGKLSSRGDRVVVQRDSGVVDAIREMAPVVKDMIDGANRRRDGGRGERRALPSSTEPTEAAVPRRPTDIVPAWLRPFMPFKRMLIGAADNGTDAPAIVELIVKNADDATWAAMIEADQAGRLESDLHAAIPELRESDARQAFAAELVEDLRRDLQTPPAEDESEVHAAPLEAPPKKSAAKKTKKAGTNG